MARKRKIDTMEFMLWADVQWTEYASEDIQTAMPGDTMRLSFSANMLGDYRVILDGLPIYEGRHLASAQDAYEEA